MWITAFQFCKVLKSIWNALLSISNKDVIQDWHFSKLMSPGTPLKTLENTEVLEEAFGFLEAFFPRWYKAQDECSFLSPLLSFNLYFSLNLKAKLPYCNKTIPRALRLVRRLRKANFGASHLSNIPPDSSSWHPSFTTLWAAGIYLPHTNDVDWLHI